jgi:UDP-glucose 4-epimerase
VKVLVTGGAGFIGGYTCQALAESGHKALVFDRRKIPIDWPVILGDICDATTVTQAVADVDGVIHLAGVLGTQETIANPYPAAETNILGGLNVLSACAQYRVPLVNIAVGNWFENNTYSITKTTVERFVRMNAVHRGVPQVSVRALNAYGPKQSVSAPYGSSKVRKIMPSFISRALHGEPIQVYGDGQQIMDMIWAGDVAKVLVAALGYVNRHDPHDVIFEAGCGRSTTVLEIARRVQAEVAEQTGVFARIEHLPLRPGETPNVEVRADTSTLEPLWVDADRFMSLAEGVHRTVSFYRLVFGVKRGLHSPAVARSPANAHPVPGVRGGVGGP